ncbi:hypothetical protein RJ639_000468 [Escallonia herrerae]|uniref:Sm domain-containing protein n=1 Tax=Escallonia herrerae TaxID=1293975 RepID=A0AA89BRN6_9ASTE|nr:hypothetical protein RJ639_000468 [Escallonia herrerae]
MVVFDTISLKIHHGAYFTGVPNMEWKGGVVDVLDAMDVDLMSYWELVGIIGDLGLPSSSLMYYQVPGLDFRSGLRLITDDNGVLSMLEYYKSTDMVPLYVERVDPLQVVGSDGNVIVGDRLLIENNNGDQEEIEVGDGDVTQADDTGGGSGKDVQVGDDVEDGLRDVHLGDDDMGETTDGQFEQAAAADAAAAEAAATSAEAAEAEVEAEAHEAAEADLPELSEGIERGPQDDDIFKEGVEEHVPTVNVNVGEGQWYSDGDNEDELRSSGITCVLQLPLSLLKTAQGHPMLVELKNGETYNGHLVNCDTWMNIHLREVICTSKDGDRFWRMPECYIRGNTIKYLRVPDEVIDKVQEEKSRSDRKPPGVGRGRGRAREDGPGGRSGRGTGRGMDDGSAKGMGGGRGRGGAGGRTGGNREAAQDQSLEDLGISKQGPP